jgi:hypothetical protein
VAIARSPKVEGLLEELGLQPAGTMAGLGAARVVEQALAAVENRVAMMRRLAGIRDRLAARAALILRMVERHWRAG